MSQAVWAPPVKKQPIRKISAGGAILNASASYWQPFYDSQTVASATSVKRLEFFQTGHTSGRRWEDTNVPTAGKLPGGQVYSVHGYAVKIMPNVGDTPVDRTDFEDFQLGLFTFYVGDSARLRLPILSLGGMGGVVAATGSDTSYLNNGSPSTNDFFRYPHKDYDEVITSEQHFRVSLTWKTAFTSDAAFRVLVYLIGDWHTIIDRN